MTGIDAPWESRLYRTFVTLADTLVQDFDVINVLNGLVTSCADLLGASAAGILLADAHGGLQVVASTSEETRLLEVFEVQNEEGPCIECYRTGTQVVEQDSDRMAERWPRFAARAAALGYGVAYALPLRLREDTIGALNLLRTGDAPLRSTDLELAQALADVATIAILHHRAMRRSVEVVEQLQAALNSRIVVEQAKGAIAERLQIDTDQAFTMLRNYARSQNRGLSEVAEAVVRSGPAQLDDLDPS